MNVFKISTKLSLNFLITSLGKLDRLRRCHLGISLEVQWLRICLPMQGTWVRSLVGELTAYMLQDSSACTWQLLRPTPQGHALHQEAHEPQKEKPNTPQHRPGTSQDRPNTPQHRPRMPQHRPNTDPTQIQHTSTSSPPGCPLRRDTES